MRNTTCFLVLFVLSISYVSRAYSQNVEKDSSIIIYVASDFSRTTYYPLFSHDDTDTRSNWFVPIVGLNVKLSEALYGTLRAGGYSIWDTSTDIHSNISIRNYMVGLKVKNPDHPFFIYVFAGLNTVDYHLEDVDDGLLPINKSFVMGANAGWKIFRTKRLSYDLSIGYTKSFDKDLSINKVYLQLSLPLIVF